MTSPFGKNSSSPLRAGELCKPRKAASALQLEQEVFLPIGASRKPCRQMWHLKRSFLLCRGSLQCLRNAIMTQIRKWTDVETPRVIWWACLFYHLTVSVLQIELRPSSFLGASFLPWWTCMACLLWGREWTIQRWTRSPIRFSIALLPRLQVPALEHKNTLVFLNSFVTQTAQFLNRFSAACEEVTQLSVKGAVCCLSNSLL